jgi:hypothetical protein
VPLPSVCDLFSAGRFLAEPALRWAGSLVGRPAAGEAASMIAGLGQAGQALLSGKICPGQIVGVGLA